jgi:hypothetical protein
LWSSLPIATVTPMPEHTRLPVPVMDPLAREEARLVAQVEDVREAVSSAAAELEELRAVLGAFEARYEARIGVLIVELDRVGLEIERYRRRIAVAVLPDEEQASAELELERELAAEQERLAAEARANADARQRATRLPQPPPPAVAGMVKERYRKLARRFHPDVAATADERARNEVAMQRINAAMEAFDLDALTVLELSLPVAGATIPGPTPGARIAWLSEEVARLEGVLTRTLGTLATVRAGSVYHLWARVEDDPRVLDRLEAELSAELTTARMELHALMSEHARLVHGRARATVGRSGG